MSLQVCIYIHIYILICIHVPSHTCENIYIYINVYICTEAPKLFDLGLVNFEGFGSWYFDTS